MIGAEKKMHTKFGQAMENFFISATNAITKEQVAVIEMKCLACNGTGRVIKMPEKIVKPCRLCGGLGFEDL